jgi:hypothetical protein
MSSLSGIRSSREREAKLPVPPSFRTPSVKGVAEGVTASSRPPERLSTTYLDTDEAISPCGRSDRTGRRAQARKLASKAVELQDVLGNVNDSVSAEEWLREAGTDASSLSEAFAAGELAGLKSAAADRCRARRKRTWRKVSAPKLRRWI